MLSLFSFFSSDMRWEHTFLIKSLWYVDAWRVTRFSQLKARTQAVGLQGSCSLVATDPSNGGCHPSLPMWPPSPEDEEPGEVLAVVGVGVDPETSLGLCSLSPQALLELGPKKMLQHQDFPMRPSAGL